MSNETPAPRGLEEVLAAHSCRDTYARVITCRCGKEFGNRFGAGDAAHRAHVAAEVRAWLVSESAVEAAARAVANATRCIDCEGTGIEVVSWSADDEPREWGLCFSCGRSARAALAAAAEVGER